MKNFKAKKKMIKHQDPEKETSSTEDKPEKTKGSTKPIKTWMGRSTQREV